MNTHDGPRPVLSLLAGSLKLEEAALHFARLGRFVLLKQEAGHATALETFSDEKEAAAAHHAAFESGRDTRLLRPDAELPGRVVLLDADEDVQPHND